VCATKDKSSSPEIHAAISSRRFHFSTENGFVILYHLSWPAEMQCLMSLQEHPKYCTICTQWLTRSVSNSVGKNVFRPTAITSPPTYWLTSLASVPRGTLCYFNFFYSSRSGIYSLLRPSFPLWFRAQHLIKATKWNIAQNMKK
jgi:hypothetical protein